MTPLSKEKVIQQLSKAVLESRRIVFFGGAGVSTESGIPDFRGAAGVYKQMPEEILSHDFFFKSPEVFYRFYKQYLLFPDIKPNITHKKLAQWEKEGRLLSVITQNIDGLHQAAGSKNVWELHGSVQRNRCIGCSESYSLDILLSKLEKHSLPLCSCGDIIKPDVVLYGEALEPAIVSGAISDLKNADLCIIGGTSLSVYPAAGLIRHFPYKEKRFFLNKDDLSEKIPSQEGFFLAMSLGEVFQYLP